MKKKLNLNEIGQLLSREELGEIYGGEELEDQVDDPTGKRDDQGCLSGLCYVYYQGVYHPGTCGALVACHYRCLCNTTNVGCYEPLGGLSHCFIPA